MAINKKGFVRVFSRHSTHDPLRNLIKDNGKKIVVRFGSTTEAPSDLEINTVQSIKNTANKLTMKRIFSEVGVSSPKFYEDPFTAEVTKFPVLAKLSFRSRGEGMIKIDNQEELNVFLLKASKRKRRYSNPYYLEQFHNYIKEYRIHVSVLGECFYTCRKMLKKDYLNAQDNWFRNDKNSVWFFETNPKFDKPDSWDLIVKDCVKALNALGLTIGAFDVKVNKEGDWIILEANSAPAFGVCTFEPYQKEIVKIIENANV